MTYKTIVTIIPDAETGARVLDTAILVGSKNDSHIIAVHAEPSAAAYVTPIGFPSKSITSMFMLSLTLMSGRWWSQT